jgi:hypothetical protein
MLALCVFTLAPLAQLDRQATQTALPPPDLAWGQAVDGIRCAVRPAQPSFAPDEDIVVDVIYENVSRHPITVFVGGDPFYTWLHLNVLAADGGIVASGPHATGLRLPLAASDFVTLQTGQTAPFRQTVRHATESEYQLRPGGHYLHVEMNKINRMDKHEPGMEEARAKHGIGPVWCSAIESGRTPFSVAASSAKNRFRGSEERSRQSATLRIIRSSASSDNRRGTLRRALPICHF